MFKRLSSKIRVNTLNIFQGLFFGITRVIYLFMSTFFDNVERLLHDRGERRSDLVRGTGISDSTIRSWNVNKSPSVDAAKKVARYFGVSIESLIEEHTDEKKEKPGFYARVLLLLEKKHITTNELCSALGITDGAFYSWAHTLPDADSAYRVAHYLRTSVEYLVTGEGENAYGSDTELVEIYRALDARDRAAVLQLARTLEQSGGVPDDDKCDSVAITVANSLSKI